MTPTDAQTEAVEGAIHRYLAEMSNEEIKWRGFSTLGHLLNEIEVEKLARATITALDIEKIEREAYERGMKDIAEVVGQWYDNYCNHIPQADLMRVLATVMEGLR